MGLTVGVVGGVDIVIPSPKSTYKTKIIGETDLELFQASEFFVSPKPKYGLSKNCSMNPDTSFVTKISSANIPFRIFILDQNAH